MVFIYVIKLEKDKYYIGKTDNPSFRLEKHFICSGSAWTKKYKPLNLIELNPDCDDYDEDKITIQYMSHYGIDNVRGGSFSKIELSDEEIKIINQMIKGASDKCFNCGESGHFIKDCIESKIQDYLKDLNIENIENIQNETIKINSIYEEIFELNRLIKLTDIICIDDLSEIKKQSQDIKKLNKLSEECRTNNLHITNNLLNEKLISINNQIQKLNWVHKIPDLYKSINNICRSNDIKLNKDIIIMGLELIKFNLEKKKRLKEIFEEYYSEDFIKELLSKLYEKEIKILESQISLK
jgi:hypothetical protein